MDKITLMMATYNRKDLTERMLSSLFKTTKESFNFAIIDNGSSDGTVGFLKDYDWGGRNVKIIYNEKNRGIAVARNQGLRIADEMGTDWYCTIDNDVELPDGWLSECIEVLKRNKEYAAIGVNMERKPYPIVEQGGVRFQSKPQGNLGTACMVFHKSLHQMLGFFTTEYILYAHEDADWGMRARVCGFKLGYIERMGEHFGEGELDTGEYREFKNKQHASNLAAFNANVRAYYRRERPVYIAYKE